MELREPKPNVTFNEEVLFSEDVPLAELSQISDIAELALTAQDGTQSEDEYSDTTFNPYKDNAFKGKEGKRRPKGKFGKGPRIFKCEKCDYSTKVQCDLIKHQRKHSETKPYVCPVEGCGHSSRYPNNIKKHMRKHSQYRPFPCEVCGVAFKTNSSLKTHALQHTDDKPILCTMCPFRCKRNTELRSHTIYTHTTEKKFECEVCGLKTKFKSDLTKHLKTHLRPDERVPAKCDICGKVCRDKITLKRHIDYAHRTEDKQCPCILCGKMFKRETLLNKHITSVHLGHKPISCEICGGKFSSKYNKATHMVTHNADRQNCCPLCPYKGKKEFDLRAHIGYSHNDQYLVNYCKCCKRKFRKKCQLRQHLSKDVHLRNSESITWKGKDPIAYRLEPKHSFTKKSNHVTCYITQAPTFNAEITEGHVRSQMPCHITIKQEPVDDIEIKTEPEDALLHSNIPKPKKRSQHGNMKTKQIEKGASSVKRQKLAGSENEHVTNSNEIENIMIPDVHIKTEIVDSLDTDTRIETNDSKSTRNYQVNERKSSNGSSVNLKSTGSKICKKVGQLKGRKTKAKQTETVPLQLFKNIADTPVDSSSNEPAKVGRPKGSKTKGKDVVPGQLFVNTAYPSNKNSSNNSPKKIRRPKGSKSKGKETLPSKKKIGQLQANKSPTKTNFLKVVLKKKSGKAKESKANLKPAASLTQIKKKIKQKALKAKRKQSTCEVMHDSKSSKSSVQPGSSTKSKSYHCSCHSALKMTIKKGRKPKSTVSNSRFEIEYDLTEDPNVYGRVENHEDNMEEQLPREHEANNGDAGTAYIGHEAITHIPKPDSDVVQNEVICLEEVSELDVIHEIGHLGVAIKKASTQLDISDSPNLAELSRNSDEQSDCAVVIKNTETQSNHSDFKNTQVFKLCDNTALIGNKNSQCINSGDQSERNVPQTSDNNDETQGIQSQKEKNIKERMQTVCELNNVISEQHVDVDCNAQNQGTLDQGKSVINEDDQYGNDQNAGVTRKENNCVDEENPVGKCVMNGNKIACESNNILDKSDCIVLNENTRSSEQNSNGTNHNNKNSVKMSGNPHQATTVCNEQMGDEQMGGHISQSEPTISEIMNNIPVNPSSNQNRDKNGTNPDSIPSNALSEEDNHYKGMKRANQSFASLRDLALFYKS